MSASKRIFTFWEPSGNIPAYLRICMKTWEKFLPEYEIVILDYSNLSQWLGENFYDDILYKRFGLAQQADAVRCAVLKKYGGIWFDTDTIITSDKVRDILNIDSELVLLNHHIGFIIAKQNARILKDWEDGIKFNLAHCRRFYSVFFNRWLFKDEAKRIKRWDYMGNSIIDKMLRVADKKYYHGVDRLKINALPEVNFQKENGINLDKIENYRKFYFNEEHVKYSLKDTCGVIYLHNSWTPKNYKQMSEEEFLSENNTLSGILKEVLGKDILISK